jgi:AcrR family transcriptional regulator
MQYLSQRLANESTRKREGQRPRRPLAATQRERILAAAEALVGEKGCAGASIEGIVKAAGVSTITFYEHFEGKEECFVAAFDRAVEETRELLVEAVSGGLPWEGQIREGLRALLEAIDADPARARLCLVEAQMGGAVLRARYDAAVDGAVPKLREGRVLESAASGISDAVEEATVGGIAWLLRQRLELAGGRGVGDLLPRVTEIALSPYLGDGLALPVEAGPAPGHG